MTTALKSLARVTGTASNAGDLLAAVRAVAGVVPARSPNPHYLNVLLGGGTLTATNGEVMVDVKCGYAGPPVALPHARFMAILSAVKAADAVTIKAKGTTCSVKAGGGEWTLPTLDAAEFPAWEPEGLEPVARIPADQLKRCVDGVAFATDESSGRTALAGILLDVKDGELTFVATDGRRLCTMTAELDQAVDDSTTLVPAKAMEMIRRLSAGEEGAVQLEANGKEIIATLDSATVTARLVSGAFPKWRALIPDRDVKPSLVRAGDLLAATSAASVTTSETSKGVTFTFSESGVHLLGKSAEYGESSVECGVIEAGAACAVRLNPTYMRQVLETLDAQEAIEVEAVDGDSAVLIRCEDSLGLIMPLGE